MYADRSYYENQYLGVLGNSVDDLQRRLVDVSDKIDSLTYNRIKGVGFDNLTPFQRSVIKDVCCQIVDFEINNADVLDTIVSSYSINGVSMQFGDNWNVAVINGVAMKRSTLELLKQSGLMRGAI